MTPDGEPNRVLKLQGLMPWLCGALSLLPFLISYRWFSDLYWFGDEWDLLDQIARFGFWPWTGQVFAENFVPFFKVLWGGLAVNFGSYILMVWVLWITHALNVALFGILLSRVGFGWLSVLLSMVLLGLPSGNIETLGWTVQWSAVLSTTFFLLSFLWYQRHCSEDRPWSMRAHGLLVLWVLASGLCFSRGVLTGFALAAACLVAPRTTGGRVLMKRAGLVLLCVLPGLLITALIMHYSQGNHRHLGTDKLGEMVAYGSWYFALNPLGRLLEVDSWGPLTTGTVGALKILIIAAGFSVAQRNQRWLLFCLLAFDLGNAVLLGIGRFHTGLETTMGSRYLYASLLCIVPFCALVMEALLRRLLSCFPGWMKVSCSLLVVCLTAFMVARNWPEEAANWSGWRGRDQRYTLFKNPNPPAENALPGISFMSTQRAKELVKRYDLH